MIARIAFVVPVVLLVALLAALAQQPTKVFRIGVLQTTPYERPEGRTAVDMLRQSLNEMGYVEGQNLVIERRSADGRVERFPALAAELVRLNVDLIFVFSTPSARAARQATTTIPIVAPTMQDPVRDGLVASLARPGGNLTGSTFLGLELQPKRLALFREAIPSISRVAALWHPGGLAPGYETALKETEAAAHGLGAQFRLVKVERPNDLDGAFAAMSRWRADGFITLPSPMLWSERKQIVDLAARHRLPAMYNASEYVVLGGLMAYGASQLDLIRRGVI